MQRLENKALHYFFTHWRMALQYLNLIKGFGWLGRIGTLVW